MGYVRYAVCCVYGAEEVNYCPTSAIWLDMDLTGFIMKPAEPRLNAILGRQMRMALSQGY